MNKNILKICFKNIAIILIIAIFFITDRILKISALKLGENNEISIFKQIFSFNFTKNYNIAFSIPFTGLLLNILIATIILILAFIIIKLIIKQKSLTRTSFLLTFILFGAISNIIDRLVYGYVIDYLALNHFAIFNIADAMISIGVIVIIFTLTKREKTYGQSNF